MPDPCSNNSKDTPYCRIHSDEENTTESSVQSSSPEDGVSVSSCFYADSGYCRTCEFNGYWGGIAVPLQI